MKTERGVKNSHALSDGLFDGTVSRFSKANGYAKIPISSSSSSSSFSSSSSSYSSSSYSASLSSPCCTFLPSGVNFIEHRVTKMDTLAGVAIKYGVEVADIKRINGLVTDLQMFAHKSLQIPLPGKHPPSPCMPNGTTQNREKTPPRGSHYDVLNSLQSLKWKPPSCRISGSNRKSPEDTEMAMFINKSLVFEEEEEEAEEDEENGKHLKWPISEPILSRHRKSRSMVNVVSLENGEETAERLLRRRQLKEERPGKGSSAWTPTSAIIESLADVFVSVRKSSSASNLTESDACSSSTPASSSSIWPILDGFSKPIVAWRSTKAALD